MSATVGLLAAIAGPALWMGYRHDRRRRWIQAPNLECVRFIARATRHTGRRNVTIHAAQRHACTMARALLGLITLLTPACATLPEPVARASEHAFARAEETALGRIAAPALRAHDGQSGFVILDTGREAFLQRAALIEAAERSIDAQYYIWNSDPSGRYLARRLLNAADRGVRVRLLLDDMNISGRDAVIAALDRHPNIDIRIFNPFAARSGPGKWLGFIGSFQRLNRRMHNKSFVADAAFGIVGGRNIGDEYFDLHPQMNFRDRDVMAAGPVVHAISDSFDAY